MQLSARLKTMASYVISGEPAADIGTDHAQLPIYLVLNNLCPRVIATDLKEMPLSRARKVVVDYGLLDKIDLRLGDGLYPLKPGEVKSVVIAGIGGNNIAEIIKKRPEVAREVRLILQPMADSFDLRIMLGANGYQIIEEELVIEKSRLYEIIVAQAGFITIANKIELGLGPLLIRRGDELARKYLITQKIKYEKILLNLSRAQKMHEEKIREIKEILAFIEEVLANWPIPRR
ncbi:tRNA (adenine(22)-N(1))-methyltransferase [Carboxydothermus pertinax]|uniref:SAM-dependent methyltransferase n=1 Tax=Carboxydothermus pertinax TaxID=870242 RepID=A0A1L8CWL9_9THEO|nr:class I SAM-dependent methyltransferase [Carboxydothermus pertinax]GAV23335.1 hypothetical protein cpu_18450 [Carboxydothermus pertinax]